MPGEGSRGRRHRSLSLFAAALALFVLVGWCAAAVRAWEQADYEIFDLYDSLVKLKGEKDEDGNKVDFYNVLGVTPKSSSAEITKAYRKASLALHPDKNPEKDTSALYALLTSINAILKDADSRERYDRHLARGIPRWRGTGYFIARYKPGVTFISTFVVVAISFTQYLTSWILYILKKRRLGAERASRESTTKNNADDLTYTHLRKMIKRAGLAEPPASVKKAIRSGVAVAEILKFPEMKEIAEDFENSVEEDEEILYLQEQVDAAKPKITNILLIQLPIWTYRLLFVTLPTATWRMISGEKTETKKKRKGKDEDAVFFEGKTAAAAWNEDEDEEDEDDDDSPFVDEDEDGDVRVTGINKKAEARAAIAAGKKGSLTAKFREQRQRRQNRQENSAEDGEEGEEQAEPSPRIVRKRVGPGQIKSKSGVVISKAELIKRQQALQEQRKNSSA